MNKVIALLLMAMLAPLASAAPGTEHPPISASAQWYVHANLDRMRHSVPGRHLYDYLHEEVLSDLADEFGAETIDAVNAVTVFGGRANRSGILLHAFFDMSVRQRLLEGMRAGAPLDGFDGHEVYSVTPDSLSSREVRKAAGDSLYLAFGRLDQVLMTTDRDLLDEFFAAGAHFTLEPAGDLLVIRAGDALVRGTFDNRGDWVGQGAFQSQMLRNVEQFGLVLGEVGRQYELRMELQTPTPETAAALRNVVYGLISLHALVDEAHANVHELLGRLNINTDANRVSLGLMMDPEELMELVN